MLKYTEKPTRNLYLNFNKTSKKNHTSIDQVCQITPVVNLTVKVTYVSSYNIL